MTILMEISIKIEKKLHNPYNELKHSGKATHLAPDLFASHIFSEARKIFCFLSLDTNSCTNAALNAAELIKTELIL